MSDDNPFAMGNQYSASVHYGGAGSAPTNAAPASMPGDLIKDTTTAGFAADVIQESRRQPVLVDFWAPWCGPCRQLTPLLEKAVLAAGGKVKLVKMNIDEHPSIAGQLGVQSIPAVFAFKDGQPVDGFMGAVPESQITEFIGKLGGDDAGQQIAEALTAAAQASEAGDSSTAANIYGSILQQAPETVEAIAGLAGVLFDGGDMAQAEAVLATVPEASKDAVPVAAIRARMALAAQAAALGDPAEFERRLMQDPKDHDARFGLAMIQNSAGERGKAADNLLEIVKVDRGWRDDGARTQLLQFFESWGAGDEATLAARRKLSSLLFS
ncbi:thioredoxin [Manganibacter manganicus]|uniref:Thioredoxin n=1 Tax=Manganibacter manganicus TaxID=1873176 RepID=A0A1V8RVI0_9HYPH|nr:thioredoxin [Pseudaminobacter manganicus]OQM77220.1 thioredoxin [Pseudaminobacter manganicus]